MVKFGNMVLFVLLSVAVIFPWLPISECAKKEARKEDIPYIKCQVCEKLSYQLYYQVLSKQAKISPKKISEFEIIEITENVCNLKRQEADWILKIDIVEQGDRLELIEQESEGQCNSKCKTIECVCQDVMGYSDTDIAEYLYNNKPQLDSLVNFLCKDLTETCSAIPPPVPKDRIPGVPFVPKPPRDKEAEKLLRSIESMPGAHSAKMYSREDILSESSDDEDEDEDDDDEAENPTNLGKPAKEEEIEKVDWKQKIMKGIAKACEALKKQSTKVSYKISKWWGFKKEELEKTKKPSKDEL